MRHSQGSSVTIALLELPLALIISSWGSIHRNGCPWNKIQSSSHSSPINPQEGFPSHSTSPPDSHPEWIYLLISTWRHGITHNSVACPHPHPLTLFFLRGHPCTLVYKKCIELIWNSFRTFALPRLPIPQNPSFFSSCIGTLFNPLPLTRAASTTIIIIIHRSATHRVTKVGSPRVYWFSINSSVPFLCFFVHPRSVARNRFGLPDWLDKTSNK